MYISSKSRYCQTSLRLRLNGLPLGFMLRVQVSSVIYCFGVQGSGFKVQCLQCSILRVQSSITPSPCHPFSVSPILRVTPLSFLPFSPSPLLCFTPSPFHPFPPSRFHPFSVSPILRFTPSPCHPFIVSPLLPFSVSPLLRFTPSPLLRAPLHLVSPSYKANRLFYASNGNLNEL